MEDEELWVEGVGRGREAAEREREAERQIGKQQSGRWNRAEPGGVCKQKAERG